VDIVKFVLTSAFAENFEKGNRTLLKLRTRSNFNISVSSQEVIRSVLPVSSASIQSCAESQGIKMSKQRR
jgi:hypothetical protein